MRKIVKFLAMFAVSATALFAQQNNLQASFLLNRFPTWVVDPNETVEINWRNPIGGSNFVQNRIRFGRNPGGSNPNNYTQEITNFEWTGDDLTGIRFVPNDNPNFRPGINYVIVANPNGRTSNEIKIILKHTEQSSNLRPNLSTNDRPLDNATPQFSWTKPAGVPYSHIVLSDERIQVDSDDGTISFGSVKGISMIWQAITANTRIIYGEPDPSGVFTAPPPPLSPGKRYSWLVFNNYGNSPVYTAASDNDLVLPGFFEIAGQARRSPQNVFPASGDNLSIGTNDIIEFKWTNLDTAVSVYRVLVYTKASIGEIEAQMMVWSGEVTAGQFRGATNATLSMSAKDILSQNDYSWRVIAIYGDGSGQSGDLSYFSYSAPTGTIVVETFEEEGGFPLAGVEIELEVIEGTLEETVLFFTDDRGWAERNRAVGTSRITAKKRGYESVSQIITVSEDNTTNVRFTLHRPIPSIFGRIIDEQGNPVDLANIAAVSDNGDTVRAQSLPDGNFTMNCRPESWTLSVSRQGFLTRSGIRVILANNAIRNLENITIERNPLVFSGTVRNDRGAAVTGAVVRIFSEDGNTEVASLLSTPSTGRFSFSLLPGIYQLSVTKSGLVSHSSELRFSASQDRVITLQSGAALLQGTLRGISWVGDNQMTAAVTGARVEVLDATTKDIVAAALTDRFYGTYSISVPARDARYLLRFSTEGFDTVSALTDSSRILSGNTYQQDFTIHAFASITGNVRRENGRAADGVSVSLVQGGRAVATSVSDREGNITFFRAVRDGSYEIFANGNRQMLKTATPSTLNVQNGRFDAPSINIITEDAKGEIIWSARTSENNRANDPSIAIVVYSPFNKKLGSDGVLSGIDPNVGYFVRASSFNDPNIIDCVEKETRFTDFSEDVLRDTILMPFRYVPSNSRDTGKTTLSVSAWTGFDSAFVYYRHRGETEFVKSAKITTGGISFVVEPKNPGNTIELYFDIFANGARYNNRTNLFTKFVAADEREITQWELLPVADNITLARNGRINLYVRAYYGASFDTIPGKNLNESDFTWTLKTNNASTGRTGLSNVITGNRPGKDTLVVRARGRIKPGVRDSIVLPITITDREIASIRVVLHSELERPEFLRNNERAIFGVEARDGDGKLVSAMPTWIINPPQAVRNFSSQSGLFIPDSSFIGRADIVAQINSRIRNEFVHDDEKGLLIAYTANRDGGTVINYASDRANNKTAELIFLKDAAENPVIVSLDKPISVNSAERNIEETDAFIISDIFEIKRRIGEDFSETVNLKLYIPLIYHSNFNNGQRDREKLDIAIWDRDNFRWVYSSRLTDASDTTPVILRNFHYCESEKSLTIPIHENINKFNDIRVAIIARGLKTEAEVSISPNPFSPFISPINDYLHILDMNPDVKGTCIKITPKSSASRFKSSAQVSIFTADGTPVYRATLNGLNAGQSYYLFWDGRTQLSPAAFSNVDIQPGKAIFVRGNEMCRNGRYFVNVTLDDGKEKKRYTKEIILFK